MASRALNSNGERRAEPVTIAYVIFGLACGGAEMVLLELVKGLDRARFKPIVISLAPPSALSRNFAAADVEVHYLGLRALWEAPLTLLRALKLERALKPAILHGVMFYGDLTARLLHLFDRTPHVVSAVHSTRVGPPLYGRVMHWTDACTDAVTAVSQAVADAHLAAGNVRRDKIIVIPNGIDLERFARPPEGELGALRERFQLSEADRVLLCVGRLTPEKNHALLLRAFARVLERVPSAKLLLAGSGALDEPLRALAAELSITTQVRFAGSIDPIGPVFHLAELFVLASYLEGLPLVVLEAMAAERPMVLTAVGGIPEVVENERTGILVPSNDEDALVRAILRLLEARPEERAALGRAARAHVELNFSMQRMVERTQVLYEKLLA